uniref:Uncharacterized protein n=1 Tax=Romanomermis culicivorax TaxID=13658 RepID=A0A915HLW1_ROMCU
MDDALQALIDAKIKAVLAVGIGQEPCTSTARDKLDTSRASFMVGDGDHDAVLSVEESGAAEWPKIPVSIHRNNNNTPGQWKVL